MTDKQRIRAWYGEILRETGWSAAHWARLAKTSPTNITRLQKDPDAGAPRTETLQKLFRVLPQSLRDKAPGFLFGDPPITNLAEPPVSPLIAETESGEAQLPVLGDGNIPVARVNSPPSLVGVRGAYALYARDASMEPRYFEGDMVYVNPIQPPKLNDFIILRFKTGEISIRRLIGRSEDQVTLERYQPHQIETVARETVLEIHRILNSDELWR